MKVKCFPLAKQVGQLGTVFHFGFQVNSAGVILHGLKCNEKFIGNLLIGESLTNARYNFGLPF